MKVTNSLTNNLPRLLLLGTVLANIAISFAQVPGTKLWEFATGAEVESSPAIGADGTVYVGSWDNGVYALDGATGAKRWEFATSARVTSIPAIGADGTPYVGSWDNRVYALDGATGAKRWEFATGARVTSIPAIGADGTVYVGSHDYKVYALDGATGAKRWEFATLGEVWSSPTIVAGGRVYVGSMDGKVYALASSSKGGLARSPWPMRSRNAQHTGRAMRPPVITTSPQNQTVAVGTNVTFTVTATGTEALTYQWRKDGVPIPDATNSAFSLQPSALPDVGNYDVVVSNAAGSVTSQAARLILEQPAHDNVPALVWIPPGTFTMGSPAGEQDREPDEGPQTQVR